MNTANRYQIIKYLSLLIIILHLIAVYSALRENNNELMYRNFLNLFWSIPAFIFINRKVNIKSLFYFASIMGVVVLLSVYNIIKNSFDFYIFILLQLIPSIIISIIYYFTDFSEYLINDKKIVQRVSRILFGVIIFNMTIGASFIRVITKNDNKFRFDNTYVQSNETKSIEEPTLSEIFQTIDSSITEERKSLPMKIENGVEMDSMYLDKNDTLIVVTFSYSEYEKKQISIKALKKFGKEAIKNTLTSDSSYRNFSINYGIGLKYIYYDKNDKLITTISSKDE